MKFFNLRCKSETVSFVEAVKMGMGKNRGLFFPEKIPVLSDMDTLLSLPFVERSCKILGAWLADEIGQDTVDRMVNNAFNFQLNCSKVDEQMSVLELFHGPTLAFKDFGARFMAQCLSESAKDEQITILTATSGDTGAAVAQAFLGMKNIRVVVLYPKGKISTLQEKLFCTLGQNIFTIAVKSDFDACQELVKRAFVDADIMSYLQLNSANSINISRLLAQICYYFEAVAAFGKDAPVISVPCGNFGNLTAGLLAQAMGLPVKRFIAATNSNDTVPRYLSSKNWQPEKTVATMSNAMDVSEPSNWPRIEELFTMQNRQLSSLESISISEEDTRSSMQKLFANGYIAEPHAAVAAEALRRSLGTNESGVFLATAHPAKFKDAVENTLSTKIELPPELAAVVDHPILSCKMLPEFDQLKSLLMSFNN